MSSNDGKPKKQLSVDLAARAEAKLEVKTEVPAASAERLVDALTDIIRPFTERRGFKADLLRLQREEVAIQIARWRVNGSPWKAVQSSPYAPKYWCHSLRKGRAKIWMTSK
jgi:hypothetical protein